MHLAPSLFYSKKNETFYDGVYHNFLEFRTWQSGYSPSLRNFRVYSSRYYGDGIE